MNKELLLRAKDISIVFGGLRAVSDFSLDLYEGELIGLIGPNGAGKTTTIKMLSSLIVTTEGDIIIDKFDMKKNKQKIKEIINISPQITSLAPNLTVRENLEFIAGAYQIKNKEQKIKELVDMFDLSKIMDQKAKTLSGGWQRKLSIAMSLINDPKILFLDEPTLGLDVISRKELWKIIESKKGKMTIILTTHYMEEAEHLSDKIGIIVDGILLDEDTPKALKEKTKTNTLEDAFVKIATGGKI